MIGRSVKPAPLPLVDQRVAERRLLPVEDAVQIAHEFEPVLHASKVADGGADVLRCDAEWLCQRGSGCDICKIMLPNQPYIFGVADSPENWPMILRSDQLMA